MNTKLSGCSDVQVINICFFQLFTSRNYIPDRICTQAIQLLMLINIPLKSCILLRLMLYLIICYVCVLYSRHTSLTSGQETDISCVSCCGIYYVTWAFSIWSAVTLILQQCISSSASHYMRISQLVPHVSSLNPQILSSPCLLTKSLNPKLPMSPH